MKTLIILGNTRKNSNTETLARLFADELIAAGETDISFVSLMENKIKTCVGCDKCHSDLKSFGCVLKDDMKGIAKEILLSDLVVFASPIYTWMPTPPLKAVMDRIYAFTKYPKDGDAFNLLKNQKLAMIATSGDDCATNCDLFDESVRRMAKFANLEYLGYLAAKDHGDGDIIKEQVFVDTRAFVQKCIE